MRPGIGVWDGTGPLHVLNIHMHETKLVYHKALFNLGPDTTVSLVPHVTAPCVYAVEMKQYCSDEL